MLDSGPSLLGKSAEAVRAIALDILGTPPEERIKTTAQYAQDIRVGHGTVQKALRILQESGIVRLEARGHLGTFAVERELKLLAEASGIGVLGGLAPLPDSREAESVATGLVEVFRRAEICLNLGHLPGARRRLERLKAGWTDFTVLSLSAAQTACAEDASLFTVLVGRPGSYYAADSLIALVSDRIQSLDQLQRIGIDRASPDHVELTQREFRDSTAQFVEVRYQQIPELILADAIDGAIWHKTTRRTESVDASESGALRPHQLQNGPRDLGWTGLSTLAITALRDNHLVREVFRNIVHVAEFEAIRAEVMSGRRVPSF